MDEAHGDPRDELFEIATSVRALVEWYEGTGAWGLPPSPPREVEPAFHAAEPQAEPQPQRAPVADRRPAPTDASFAPPASFSPPPERSQPPAAPTFTPAAPPRTAVARGESLTPEARVERLHLLATEVASCTRCRLSETRTQPVFARGNPLAELCFVGDGPGPEEDAAGEPFVGEAGQLLDRMIVAMGYRPTDVYVCGLVKCGPIKDHKLEGDAVAACKPYLATQIELARPKYIVALGTSATQGLLATSESIAKLRGTWKMYRGIPVMPTYHPAFVVKKPSARREVWDDLQKVMALLGKKPPPPRG